jgi:TonB family protein
MTINKLTIWILASLCTLVIASCGNDRKKLSKALVKYDAFGSFDKGLARVEKGGKVGLIDKTGKEIVPCIYNETSGFSEGFATIKKDGKWGFIDTTGKEAVPCSYDNAGGYSEGLACVEKNGKWGFIDKTGKEVIPCSYEMVNDFSEGLARVQKYGEWGIIDKTGKLIVPCSYDYVDLFREGFARVKKYGEWGIIDKTGKTLVPCSYKEAGYFSEGLARVQKKLTDETLGYNLTAERWGFIDTTGQEVIPCIYERVNDFSEGLAGVEKNRRWGFIDKTGKEVIVLGYSEVNDFREGLARVKKGYKYGIINKTGTRVASCIYDRVDDFSEGLAQVQKDGKWGFINRTGKPVAPCIYEKTGSLSEGLASVRKDNISGFIDKTGRELFLCVFYSAESFSDGLARVNWKNQEGYVDKEGYFIGKGVVEKIATMETAAAPNIAEDWISGNWGIGWELNNDTDCSYAWMVLSISNNNGNLSGNFFIVEHGMGRFGHYGNVTGKIEGDKGNITFVETESDVLDLGRDLTASIKKTQVKDDELELNFKVNSEDCLFGRNVMTRTDNTADENRENNNLAQSEYYKRQADYIKRSKAANASNEQKIKTLINNYYTAFANREYYKLDNFFAETVYKFFAQKNVKGSTIKDSYKEYHEKNLKTKSISYAIRWETFEQEQTDNGIVTVNFIMDYYLDSEKYGNQKYVLQIKIDIDNNYKIVGMNEKTLDRQQASASPEISQVPDEVDEIIPFAVVEVKPKFQGKDAGEFVKWINSELANNYPKAAIEQNLQGTVRVSFTVNIDGTLSDIKSLRKVDPILEECVIELVKKSPKWTPGRQKNKPVKVTYQIPVIFKRK